LERLAAIRTFVRTEQQLAFSVHTTEKSEFTTAEKFVQLFILDGELWFESLPNFCDWEFRDVVGEFRTHKPKVANLTSQSTL